jgi:bifunctional non-homologous end joining protein LigD
LFNLSCLYSLVTGLLLAFTLKFAHKHCLMALTSYRKKRNFKESPEPKGGKADTQKLRFVIQKHDASHLHYDFRLEMEGVLKSWAIPKGPSTDPSVKRLAMMVEDHPYDYRNFEGIIPSGYGAGTVIVWDEGFYEPADAKGKDKKTLTKELMAGLRKGKLHIILKGKKVKGEYGLIKAFGRSENSWLLFKVKDDYVSTDDITLKDKSVISKKTLKQIEKTSTHFYGAKRVKESSITSKKEKSLNTRSYVKAASARNAKEKETAKGSSTSAKKVASKKVPAKKSPVKKAAVKRSTAKKATAKKTMAKKTSATASKKKAAETEAILKSARKATFPAKLKPMLATLVDKPFDEDGWLYEVKWDGYRALAFSHKGQVELKSRNDKSFDEKFYPVKEAVEAWGVDAVVDGEIVVVKEDGISSFGALQNWRSDADGDLYYYVFDLIWYNGKDLSRLPLTDRKAILKSIIPEEGIIKYSESFSESGTQFFEAAKKTGLEGIIAKKADSLYHSGDRSSEWLKIKANKRQEVVIGGYTKNDDSSKLFSALLVGFFEKGKLIYTGKIGTGFNTQDQRDMLKQFKALIVKKPPFSELPDINKPSRFRPNPPHATATWLKPQLVCEVSYTEMTSDGVMRHPSFEGMRIDKKANDVMKEVAKPTKKTVAASSRSKREPVSKTKPAKKVAGAITKAIVAPVAKRDRKTLLNPTDETQVRNVNGHELKFTNLSKLYWPKEKISKRDMINYYYQVAPYILPYLKDRPQSMLRHPDGITKFSFFYKNIKGKAPDWVETFDYHAGDGEDKEYLVARDDASLLYMASLGCIEMNPWHSRIQKEDFPDWCIMDLDPGSKTNFNQVIETALVCKDILNGLGADCYVKTSGSTGMHIYIPFGAKYTYDQSKEFARVIARLVQEQLPEITSVERTVKDRRGKLYIDFLQNRPQATVSAPYSLRPKPGATVSMPLHWDEVKKGLKMSDFNIHNALDRIKSEGDLFKPVLGKGINLKKIVSLFNTES